MLCVFQVEKKMMRKLCSRKVACYDVERLESFVRIYAYCYIRNLECSHFNEFYDYVGGERQ